MWRKVFRFYFTQTLKKPSSLVVSVKKTIFLGKSKCIYWQIFGLSNISFSFEKEINNQLSFLDVEITCKIGKSVRSVYRKPTFSGVHTHFENFLPTKHKFGMAYT